MKKFKLFFALFAMLALNVGNAWAEEETITLSTFGWSNASVQSSITATSATISLAQNSAGTAPTYYTADGLRLYGVKNSTDGGTISFTPNKGITISKIVFTHTSSNAGVLAIKTGGGSYSSKTWSGTLTEGNTVSLVSTNSGTKNPQVKITQIVITYETSGGTETAASLTANPTSLDFGNVTQNDVVEAKTFTISGSDFTTGELTIAAPEGYSVSPTTVEVNGSLEETTITVTPNTSTVGTFNDNVTISGANLTSSVNVALSMTVEKAPATPTENVYVKVTTTAGITDGEYLIVYEDAASETPAPVAFDGSLETLDADSNNIAVTISNNTIAGNTDIDAAIFTIDATAGTIKSASGYYIGQNSDANGVSANSSTVYTNTLSIADDGTATIKSSGGAYLRYNSAKDNWRFRYFKSSTYTAQKAIALYKKASKHTVTIATCTNGSVSAKMGETALATNDQVLSGIQITLNNTPAENYKLAAYDVYKTGDAETKVTVTDGKFIMPEFDVTISATFEVAKTLKSIEITNAATQTIFWQTETFNHNGLQVTAHFDGAADEDVTDKVTVTGSTATAGEQTVTVSFIEGTVTETTTYKITVKAIPNTKETAYTVADAYDIIDKLTTANGVFIKGIVSKVDSYNSTYKSITYWISADGNTTNQLQVYSGKGLDNADFASKLDLTVSDQVIVVGTLKKFNSTYEFDKNNSLASHTKTTKADPELSYTTTEYNVNLGDAFTTPTLNNPHSLEVTYSSSKEDVATVADDGAVTIKAAGTVTITASFAGNETYLAGNASYTINVTDPSVSEATFVAGTDKSDTKSISKNGITVTFTDGTFSRDDNYRCYGGKEMTISYADGNITKIVIECTANDGAENGPGQFTTEPATYSYSGKVGTWTGEATSVTFTAGTQVRMTTITVYYKQDTRTPAGIAWNPATVSLTVGDAFTAPTFNNPNRLAVSFESSNTELATVDNVGLISLVSGKTGTATITALYAGDETYKAAKVTCTITVDHQSTDIVILAKCKDQYYALVAEYVEGKTNVLQALPVEYVGGKIYNVETEDQQASIIWKRSVVDGKTTFKHGENYLSAVNSTDLNLATEACEWVFDGDMYKIEGSTRTILYSTATGGFKNYSTNNISNDGVSSEYSSAAITVAPVFADGDAYHRTVTSGNYGTMCIPYGTSNYSGAKFYEVSWLETDNALWLDEVNGALVAGKPYIFLAIASEIAIIGDGTTADAPVAGTHGLTGTFTDIAAGGVTNNYIIAQNCIWVANDNNYVNAYRAYIKASDLPTTEQAQLPGRRRVCMGENVETGLDQIGAPEDQTVKVIENGQLIIIREGVKYNVQGQKL